MRTRSRQLLLQGGVVAAVDDGKRLDRERVAQHGGVLEEGTLLGWEGIEARRDERLKGLGDLEGPELSGDRVGAVALDEDVAVDEHPHGLDGVERYPLGALEDLGGDVLGKALDEPTQQLAHGAAGQGLEMK